MGRAGVPRQPLSAGAAARAGPALCPLPSALCPLPSALCPLPSALCPLPSALCPLPFAPLARKAGWRHTRRVLRLGIAAALLGVLAVPAQAGPRERNFWEWVQDPNGAEIRVVLARVQENLNAAAQLGDDDPAAAAMLEDARGMLRFGLRLEPDHPRLLHAMGQVCDRLGRLDEVVSALEHYLRVEPSERALPEARLLLGRAHARRGDLRPAIAQLVQAAAPGDSAAVLALAEAYLEVGRLGDAIDVLEHQTRRRAYYWGGDELIHLALAAAYDRDEQLARAREVVERLVTQRRIIDLLRGYPGRSLGFWSTANRHYVQAYAYELAGHVHEARAEWLHCARLDGRHRARALAHVRAIDAGRPMAPATQPQMPVLPRPALPTPNP